MKADKEHCLIELIERMQLASRSKERYVAVLLAYEKWCAEKRRKPENPATGFMYRQQLLRDNTTVLEINRTISVISSVVRAGIDSGQYPAWIGRRFSLLRLRNRQKAKPLVEIKDLADWQPETVKEVRDLAMMQLFVDTGCRMSELQDMQWGDLAEGRWGIHTLTPRAWTLLMNWKNDQPVVSQNVWTSWAGRGRPTTKRMNAQAIWRVVKQRAGQLGYDNVTPQAIRRSVLTRDAERLGKEYVEQVYGVSRRQVGYLKTNSRRQK